MKRLLILAALGVAIFTLGCDFENIDLSNITSGDNGETEVANADSTSTTTDGSTADGAATDGEPGDDGGETPPGDVDSIATTDGELQPAESDSETADGEAIVPEGETGSSDGAKTPVVDLEKLGKLEREIAEAFLAAGAKIKVENSHVTELSWQFAQLNPQIVSQLYKLTWLNALDLQYSNMSDELIVGVELLRQLQYISLDGTKIGDATMGRLVLKATPTYIDADSTQVTGNTLDGLLKIRKQVTVCLARNPPITDEMLKAAAQMGRNRLGLVGDGTAYGKVGPRREFVGGVRQTN